MDDHSATREAESEAALSRIPTAESWGVCVSGDGPPTAGGVTRGFFWFETEDGLLSFVSRHVAWLDLQPVRIDVALVHARVQLALTPFLDGREPVERLPSALNPLLQGLTQIEWAGQLSDLLSGDGEYARSWRDRSRGERGDDSPIRPAEIDTFIDSIAFPIF